MIWSYSVELAATNYYDEDSLKCILEDRLNTARDKLRTNNDIHNLAIL